MLTLRLYPVVFATLMATAACGHHGHHGHNDASPWKADPLAAMQGTWFMRGSTDTQYQARMVVQGADVSIVSTDGNGHTGTLEIGPSGLLMLAFDAHTSNADTDTASCHGGAPPSGSENVASNTMLIFLHNANNAMAWNKTETHTLVRALPVDAALLGDWEECNARAPGETAKVTISKKKFVLYPPDNKGEPQKIALQGMAEHDDTFKLIGKDGENYLAINMRWVEPKNAMVVWPEGAENILFFYYKPGKRPAWAICD